MKLLWLLCAWLLLAGCGMQKVMYHHDIRTGNSWCEVYAPKTKYYEAAIYHYSANDKETDPCKHLR